jgi:hypothetical protein
LNVAASLGGLGTILFYRKFTGNTNVFRKNCGNAFEYLKLRKASGKEMHQTKPKIKSMSMQMKINFLALFILFPIDKAQS